MFLKVSLTRGGKHFDKEKVHIAHQKLLTVQSQLKSYFSKCQCELNFSIRDHVYLKVSPTKGVKHFGMQGKLSPRYIGHFEVLERIDPVAYRIVPPPSLAGVHNIFHVSLFRKYVPDPTHIICYPLLELWQNLSYDEYPDSILAGTREAVAESLHFIYQSVVEQT